MDLVLLVSLPALFSLSLALHSAQRGTGGWKAERRHLRDNDTAKAHLQLAPAYTHSCLILSLTLWGNRRGDSRFKSYGLIVWKSSFWRGSKQTNKICHLYSVLYNHSQISLPQLCPHMKLVTLITYIPHLKDKVAKIATWWTEITSNKETILLS